MGRHKGIAGRRRLPLDPMAIGENEEQYDDQERHSDAEESEEDDPDDGEDRADDEQHGARGELLSEIRPAEIRGVRTGCPVKMFSGSGTRTYGYRIEASHKPPPRVLTWYKYSWPHPPRADRAGGTTS